MQTMQQQQVNGYMDAEHTGLVTSAAISRLISKEANKYQAEGNAFLFSCNDFSCTVHAGREALYALLQQLCAQVFGECDEYTLPSISVFASKYLLKITIEAYTAPGHRSDINTCSNSNSTELNVSVRKEFFLGFDKIVFVVTASID